MPSIKIMPQFPVWLDPVRWSSGLALPVVGDHGSDFHRSLRNRGLADRQPPSVGFIPATDHPGGTRLATGDGRRWRGFRGKRKDLTPVVDVIRLQDSPVFTWCGLPADWRCKPPSAIWSNASPMPTCGFLLFTGRPRLAGCGLRYPGLEEQALEHYRAGLEVKLLEDVPPCFRRSAGPGSDTRSVSMKRQIQRRAAKGGSPIFMHSD